MGEYQVTRVTITTCGDIMAWTDGVEWVCDDPRISKLLNARVGRERAREAYGYVPDMALAMAELAEERIPLTKIVKVEDRETYDPRLIY